MDELLQEFSATTLPYLLQSPAAGLAAMKDIKRLTASLDDETREHLAKVPREQWTSILQSALDDRVIRRIAERNVGRPGPIEFDDKEEVAYVTDWAQEQFRIARGVFKGLFLVVSFLVSIVGIVVGLIGAIPTAGGSLALAATIVAGLIGAALVLATLIDALIDYIASFFPGSTRTIIAVGFPMSGGGGGQSFHLPAGDVQRLTKVEVFSGAWSGATVVGGLAVDYLDNDGKARSFLAGHRSDTMLSVALEPGDELVSLAGRAESLVDSLVLTIQRSDGRLESFGPIGGDGGRAYTLALPAGIPIRGFVGRAGAVIDALAVQGSNQGMFAGRLGGAPFFDKGIVRLTETGLRFATRLTAVAIWHGDAIDAIAAEWTRDDGVHVVGVRHGGEGGTKTVVDLDDDEDVRELEVATGWYGGYDVITHLSFKTSKGRSFAFGRDPRHDTLTTLRVPPAAKLVGFYGFAGGYLDGLGLCLH